MQLFYDQYLESRRERLFTKLHVIPMACFAWKTPLGKPRSSSTRECSPSAAINASKRTGPSQRDGDMVAVHNPSQLMVSLTSPS